MTFFAQAAAAAQQLQSGSPAETLGLVGICYALIRLVDGLIAKALPGRVGKRSCSWTETDAAYVATATRESAASMQLMSANLREFGEIVKEMQHNQVEMRVALAAHNEAAKR